MFKPIRFNPQLKAEPGLAHLTHTHAHQTETHQDVKETVDVDQHSTEDGKETHAHAHITKEVEQHPEKDATVTHTKVKAEVDVTTQSQNSDGSTELMHVHSTISGVSDTEMTPPHPPREETPMYNKTHNHLVNKLDEPCAICGVRKSTIGDPKQNLFGAKDLETHHYPIERSLLNACDPTKIAVIFPQVKDRETLEAFIDSEANMIVLCDIHHRHPLYGIHHLVGPDFSVQPFLFGGYQVVAGGGDVEKIKEKDEEIVKEHITDAKELYGDPATIAHHTHESKETHA